MDDKYIIGIDAGGTKVAYGLFRAGQLIDRLEHPTDASADGPAFADTLLGAITQIIDKHAILPSDLLGVGVCMPSFLLFDDGYVCLTSAMPNIKNFAMRDYMQNKLDTRIVLDNDSNAAALAEYRHGAGQGSRHMVYISVSTGIGSGIIIDGSLFRGSYGWAGECGHMLATPGEGIMCGCQNRGCFMSHAAGRFAHERVKARLSEGGDSVLAACGKIDGPAILNAYNQGDGLARETVQDMAHYLAVCVFNVYQMLNINLFVFGGGLVSFGDALFKPMRSQFDSYNHIDKPVYFKFAQLKRDFGIIGAAELIRSGR